MNDLKFKITAIDNATAVGARIVKSFDKMTNPLRKLTNRLEAIGRRGNSALGTLNRGLTTVADTTRVVSDRIASIVPGLAALTGVAGVAGIGALAERWGNLGFNLQTTGRQLGMSARGLAQWHYAAQRAGVTADQFDQSMFSSQNTIRSAAFGANPQAMMLLNRLGVQIGHTQDGQIDYQGTQRAIMAALGRIRNPAGQRTAADELGMGALLPMIQRGTYTQDRQTALINGYAPTNEAIRRAAAFRDQMNSLHANISGLANTVGDKLVPVLTPMIQKLNTWLSDHRVDIANRFAAAVGKFATWISSVDWGGLYNTLNNIAGLFGGWGVVIGDLIALKFASTVLGWTTEILAFKGALRGANGAASELVGVAEGGAAAGPAAGGIGLIGKLGIAGLASQIALEVARRLGLPDTNVSKGQLDVQQGRWWDASFDLPAGQFFNAVRDHTIGSGFSGRPIPGGINAPKGIRNNNPLNMMPGGAEATYPTAIDGIAAATENLRRNYSGLTLRQLALKWTGDTPSQVVNYLRLLEAGTGLGGNQTPDLNNPALITSLFKAQIRAENGQEPYSDADILAGVKAGISGRRPTTATDTTAAEMSNTRLIQALEDKLTNIGLQIHITAPPGVRAEAKNSQGESLPTKVSYAMVNGAMP